MGLSALSEMTETEERDLPGCRALVAPPAGGRQQQATAAVGVVVDSTLALVCAGTGGGRGQ